MERGDAIDEAAVTKSRVFLQWLSVLVMANTHHSTCCGFHLCSKRARSAATPDSVFGTFFGADGNSCDTAAGDNDVAPVASLPVRGYATKSILPSEFSFRLDFIRAAIILIWCVGSMVLRLALIACSVSALNTDVSMLATDRALCNFRCLLRSDFAPPLSSVPRPDSCLETCE